MDDHIDKAIADVITAYSRMGRRFVTAKNLTHNILNLYTAIETLEIEYHTIKEQQQQQEQQQLQTTAEPANPDPPCNNYICYCNHNPDPHFHDTTCTCWTDYALPTT